MNLALSCYLDGLISLSYKLSSNLGLSDIRVTCFNTKDFKKNFQKYFEIKEDIVFDKISITLKELFFIFFRDELIIDRLIDLFVREVGDIKCIYEAKNNSSFIDKLSGASNGVSGFYFVEDVFFVETKKYMVCFIIGNNE